MKRKTRIQIVLVTLFLLVVLAAMSGCKRAEETPTGPVTTFKVEVQERAGTEGGEKLIVPNVKFSQVKNNPFGKYDDLLRNLESYNKYGSGNVFQVNAIVLNKVDTASMRSLVLQTVDETLEVEIKPNTVYKEIIQDATSGRLRVREMEGDRFNDIGRYDFITVFVNTPSDYHLFTDSTIIYPEKGEEK